MEIKGIEADDVLRFQIKRILTNLFKKYLVILEDLGIEHDIAFQKFHDMLPEQYQPYVVMADYFGEEKEKVLRSKVLGAGNDALRELEDQLKNFDITIKR